MAQRASRSEQRRQERRTTILRAAISLFARKGFADAGVSEIARAAGVSHGTIFLYFASKEALFRASVLEPLESFATQSLALMDCEGTPLQTIQRLVREHVIGIAAEQSYLQLVQAAIAQGEQFGDLAEEVATALDPVGRRLSQLAAEGIAAGELAPASPDAVAASYIAYLNGIGLVILDREDTTLWESLIDQGLRLFAPTKGDRHDD
jgi:AcrR family transcriptional regulator